MNIHQEKRFINKKKSGGINKNISSVQEKASIKTTNVINNYEGDN